MSVVGWIAVSVVVAVVMAIAVFFVIERALHRWHEQHDQVMREGEDRNRPDRP